MHSILLSFFIYFFALTNLCCQELRYEDYVYLDHIRSVQFHLRGLPTSTPLIDLGSRGSLRLGFDDILGGDRDYTYRIVHCDKDWQPSQLDESEYLVGFNDEEIETYEYSVGTRTDYTHYELVIPNDDVEWRISGNYVLIVTDDESNELAITRRFMVVENKVKVAPQELRALLASNIRTHQEIELEINNERFPINSPQQQVFVTALQNGRWDNAQMNIQPQFSVGNAIRFDQTRRISFQGFNEFRGVDLRSLRTRPVGIRSIDVMGDEVVFVSELDMRRGQNVYSNFNDINGSYIIETIEFREDDLRAEYVNLFLSLFSENEIYEGEVYVIGDFTDWRCKPEWKMTYDFDNQIYYTEGLLKQGYYDYQYAIKKDDGTMDKAYFDGSHYATINQYTILVYYRDFTGRYDRIIGAAAFETTF